MDDFDQYITRARRKIIKDDGEVDRLLNDPFRVNLFRAADTKLIRPNRIDEEDIVYNHYLNRARRKLIEGDDDEVDRLLNDQIRGKLLSDKTKLIQRKWPMKGSDEGGTSINKEDIVVDPDGDSSSSCSGCRLPIFATPSVSISQGDDQLFLHKHCATLPPQLRHELHPDHTLHQITTTSTTTSSCSNCNQICGAILYACPNPSCSFRLDLLCAVPIKIVHRSHHHSMMAVRLRDSASLTCNACDTKHQSSSQSQSQSQSTTVSYLCNLCGFSIHPDCASLPNAILRYQDHQHALFLTYNHSTGSNCDFCSGSFSATSGAYVCVHSCDYLIHIRCALTNPNSFKPVFIRDAQVEDLARLPMPNEHTSLIPYVMDNIASISNSSNSSSDSELESKAADDDNTTTTTTSGSNAGDGRRYYKKKSHQHPLLLNQEIDDGDHPCRVCNACVQFISPPFLSCSRCPDFFLHASCAALPKTIQRPIHYHSLSVSQRAPKSDISAAFSCDACDLRCNGFAYFCEICDDFRMDVICASMIPTITHESHSKTHILFMSRNINFGRDQSCNCCNSRLKGICYECSICRNFKLHVRCALLPTTVRHTFDEHPLQLTTKSEIAIDGDGDDDDVYCEVCEEHLNKGQRWFYSCSECDQSFHVDCIPSVDRLSKIKLGSTVRVHGHGCAVALIREADAVCGGRRCGFCGEVFKFSDGGLIYECSDCFYGIHHSCAQKCLLKN